MFASIFDITSLFKISLFDGCIAVSHCVFNLHFLDDLWCKHHFKHALVSLIFCFTKWNVKSFSHFYYIVFSLFLGICYVSVHFISVSQSCPILCDPMNRSTQGLPVYYQLLEFYSNSCPSSRWCHPAISSSVIPFSSFPQSLPASGSFPMSQLFAWGGQSIGVSASASVLPMNTQDWSPLGWTGCISLQSKGLSRVFFNTIVQKHQFFFTQLSSQSNSHICTGPLEKP